MTKDLNYYTSTEAGVCPPKDGTVIEYVDWDGQTGSCRWDDASRKWVGRKVGTPPDHLEDDIDPEFWRPLPRGGPLEAGNPPRDGSMILAHFASVKDPIERWRLARYERLERDTVELGQRYKGWVVQDYSGEWEFSDLPDPTHFIRVRLEIDGEVTP